MTYTHKKTGKEYEMRIGSKLLVKRGKAHRTSGGLVAKDIVVTKAGRYVSRKKSEHMKKHGKKQFEKAGYALFSKGAPGEVRRIRKTRRRRAA